ncbi:MAG: hypothetical protein HY696_11015 [Deltaproteobacteria bacterium]|nr:hypothetical protein [Deltaproteobacteria bacterium]
MSTASYSADPDIIYIDAAVRGLPATQQLLAQLGTTTTTETIDDLTTLVYPDDPAAAKRRWALTEAPKPWFRPLVKIPSSEIGAETAEAPSLHWCTDFVLNAPYECSYFPFPNPKLRRPIVSVHVNLDEMLTDFSRRANRVVNQQFVLRCGDAGDALAIDHYTHFAARLIPCFAWTRHAQLELWTRTANVQHLIGLEHRGQTTIVFAVAPDDFIRRNERGTAPLADRLAAAAALADAGYRIICSLDPIVQGPDWETHYDTLIDQLLAAVPAAALQGIELSCLHYPRGYAPQGQQRFPETSIYFGELVPVNGCYRYFRPVRQQMYAYLTAAIHYRRATVPITITREHGLLAAPSHNLN